MHFRALILLPIVALLFTWAGSTAAKYVEVCIRHTDQACPHSKRWSEPWNQHLQDCIQGFWAHSVTNEECPYEEIGCLCYNGCVKASWRTQKDVGAYCHTQCKPIVHFPPC
ncbi:hypothetical protein V8E36_002113 [Tilletia maclaganii]